MPTSHSAFGYWLRGGELSPQLSAITPGEFGTPYDFPVVSLRVTAAAGSAVPGRSS